jgi:hypothetical protein
MSTTETILTNPMQIDRPILSNIPIAKAWGFLVRKDIHRLRSSPLGTCTSSL